VAAGVYLAFDGGPDTSGPDGAGIGPYDEIVLRGARAVGERAGLGKVIALRTTAGSWRDAESSSSGSDQVDRGRGELRISAGEGAVLVRFSADEVAGHTAVPDLGPFAAVVVGTHAVRADEETLAVRVSRISPWQLTDRAGSGFQGALKEALVFGIESAAQGRGDATASRIGACRPGAGDLRRGRGAFCLGRPREDRSDHLHLEAGQEALGALGRGDLSSGRDVQHE
jgi:hypothetical protein